MGDVLDFNPKQASNPDVLWARHKEQVINTGVLLVMANIVFILLHRYVFGKDNPALSLGDLNVVAARALLQDTAVDKSKERTYLIVTSTNEAVDNLLNLKEIIRISKDTYSINPEKF